MTAIDLIDTRTHNFDNSVSVLVKHPVNGWVSALPGAKLKLILGITHA